MTLHIILIISYNTCNFWLLNVYYVTICLYLSLLSLAYKPVVVTCFLWGWLETVSNTEPINNGFSKLPAPVRAAAAA